MATLQVPVLFDMSGDTIIFGEAAGEDFVTSHLDFTLDMTTEANDISFNAADLSGSILVGDHETSDGIFFSSDVSGVTTGISAIDRLCDRISKAITLGKLVHIPKTGTHQNSGIPMGGRALRNADGAVDGNVANNIYSPKYSTSIAPIGDEQKLGGAMARVACVHLVGHPLSAAMFSDPSQIQTDVETDSDQTYEHASSATNFYNALAVQLSKVLGGSKATNPLEPGNDADAGTIRDASGVSNIALKSVYEQLMNVPGRSQIMETRDITGQGGNGPFCTTGGFPVIPGDKLVLFIRPKIQFAAETEAVENTVLQAFPYRMSLKDGVSSYNVGTSSTPLVNVISGQSYSESGVYSDVFSTESNGNINPAFDGSVAAAGVATDFADDDGWGWLSPKTYADDYFKGDYVGSVQTSLAQGGIVAGEWIQVNVGQKVGITSFTIVPHNKAGNLNSIGGRSPYQFRLLKSNNGVIWKIIDRVTVGTSNTDTSEWANGNETTSAKIDNTFTLPNPEIGQYFRLVVEKIYQKTIGNGGNIDGACAIQELVLTGAKYPLDFDTHSDKAAPTEASLYDISGVGTNVASVAANIETVFPGNAVAGSASEESKWGWMGSSTNTMITLETTDENDVKTCDLHIWKITITL
jgi:hypothetical protein